MKALVIVNRLLEADPDEMSPEMMQAYLAQPYDPPYRRHTVDLSAEIWNNENKLRKAFSWLTRIGAAPKFGTLPIQYYQQDQVKAIDAIKAAARPKGIELGWVHYRNGRILAYHQGRWVPIARLDFGEITPI